MCGNGQLKHVAIPMDLAFLPSSNSNIVYFIENPVASIVDDVGGFNPSQKKEGILRSGKTFLTLVGWTCNWNKWEDTPCAKQDMH